MAFHENHRRSILKTITYRLLIIISNAIVIYLMTGDTKLTASFISITSIVSTTLYFAHERLWNEVHWGKKHLNHHVHSHPHAYARPRHQ